MSDETDIDDGLFTCWCGAKGTYEELFHDDFPASCGGLGVVDCRCGGDFCVCHNHGEVECPGCPDCEEDDDYDGDDMDYYDALDDDDHEFDEYPGECDL